MNLVLPVGRCSGRRIQDLFDMALSINKKRFLGFPTGALMIWSVNGDRYDDRWEIQVEFRRAPLNRVRLGEFYYRDWSKILKHFEEVS